MKAIIFGLLVISATLSNLYAMGISNDRFQLNIFAGYRNTDAQSGSGEGRFRNIDQFESDWSSQFLYGLDADVKIPVVNINLAAQYRLGFNNTEYEITNLFSQEIGTLEDKVETDEYRIGLRKYFDINIARIMIGAGHAAGSLTSTLTQTSNNNSTVRETELDLTGYYIEIGAQKVLNEKFIVGANLDYTGFSPDQDGIDDINAYALTLHAGFLI